MGQTLRYAIICSATALCLAGANARVQASSSDGHLPKAVTQMSQDELRIRFDQLNAVAQSSGYTALGNTGGGKGPVHHNFIKGATIDESVVGADGTMPSDAPKSPPPARLPKPIEVPASAKYPFSAICKIVALFPNGTAVTTTGILVGDKYVLTTSRAFLANDQGFASYVLVAPGYSPANHYPHGVTYAVTARTEQGGDSNWGIIALSESVGKQAGWLGYGHHPKLQGLTASITSYFWRGATDVSMNLWTAPITTVPETHASYLGNGFEEALAGAPVCVGIDGSAIVIGTVDDRSESYGTHLAAITKFEFDLIGEFISQGGAPGSKVLNSDVTITGSGYDYGHRIVATPSVLPKDKNNRSGLRDRQGRLIPGSTDYNADGIYMPPKVRP